MAEQEAMTRWASLAQDFEPDDHMMQIKGKDYLTVPNRLIWFIRDQRTLTAAGLAQVSYIIQTELVELDREKGWAHFKTYVRDVLGNEATMYGSESVRDFPDYIEKASTKSLGRALLLLGYGTQFAAELDEGERVVDSPAARPTPAPRATQPTAPARPAMPAPQTRQATGNVQTGADALATDRQISSIGKLCASLGRPMPDTKTLTFETAKGMLTEMSAAYAEARQAVAK